MMTTDTPATAAQVSALREDVQVLTAGLGLMNEGIGQMGEDIRRLTEAVMREPTGEDPTAAELRELRKTVALLSETVARHTKALTTATLRHVQPPAD